MAKPDFAGALLAGQAPRSENTASIHRLARDGHATNEEFIAEIAKDGRKLLAAQSGFALVSGGQADWLDLLRPVAKGFEGFSGRGPAGEDSVGPVTRWHRTNTFYRKPTVVGKIWCHGDEIAGALPEVERGVAFLLGPYSFARLVENSFYRDAGELAADYCSALAKSAPKVRQKGYSMFMLVEPSVGFDLSKKAFQRPGWYSECIDSVKGIDRGVHFPLADAREALRLAEDSGAQLAGIDGVCNPPRRLETQKDVLLGLVDGARTRIEKAGEIAGAARLSAGGITGPEKFYIGCNDRLYDVPFGCALAKISALSEAAGELKCS